jgi:hypothetical protein
MRTTSFFAMVIALAVSAVLLVAWPRHSGAAGEVDSIQQQILAKEREELDCLRTGNMEVFANLLADGAVFVDAQGPASKAEVAKNVCRLQARGICDGRRDVRAPFSSVRPHNVQHYRKGGLSRQGVRGSRLCFRGLVGARKLVGLRVQSGDCGQTSQGQITTADILVSSPVATREFHSMALTLRTCRGPETSPAHRQRREPQHDQKHASCSLRIC